MDRLSERERICRDYGVECAPLLPNRNVGIAKNLLDGLLPINGLRHPPSADPTGWYIWAGETLSPDDDVPSRLAHTEWCPEAVRFLGLPPGWRFLAQATRTSGSTQTS